jgi:peptidoglycan/xylan/chitin deacetylase (PgdA/CDA1 family)
MSERRPSRIAAAGLIRSAGNLIAPRAKGKGRLCILTYHRILEARDPLLAAESNLATFGWQMELLAECFNVLPLHQALHMLKHERMPPRAVCITFDDGYRSIHDSALPVLKKFDLPATVFTTTGCMNGGNMWNDRIIEAVRRLPEGALDLRHAGLGTYMLGSLETRKEIVAKLSEGVKYLLPQARLDAIAVLEGMAGETAAPGLMLDSGMIASLSRQGVEIGGHTVTHPILTTLDDDSAQREIVENKRVLETITKKPLRLFAYPNGKIGSDFDARHVNMVRDAGYSAAFTTEIGAATGSTDRYRMPRSRPWDATPFLFALRLLRWLGGREA